MIACSSLGDATLMCLAIQTSLGECETFCPALRFQKTEELDFHNPLRVRIGLHWCLEVNPTIDRMHGRYDYYGQDVNVSARVEAQATGGQIMVTADTMTAIMETEVYPLVIAPDTISALVKRNVELKGVSEAVNLYGMAPTSQVDSGYVRANLVEGLSVLGDASGDLLEVKNLSSNNSVASIKSDVMSTRGFDDCHSIAASNQGGGATTFFGTTGGRRTTTTNISPEQHLALEFSSALFRIAFKAVPEAGKSAWLKILAKQMKVPLTATTTATTSAPRATNAASEKHARRMEHFKHFELLQTAADEAYTKAHASQFPDSSDHMRAPSFDPPTNSNLMMPKTGAGTSGTSQDPLDRILGESFN